MEKKFEYILNDLLLKVTESIDMIMVKEKEITILGFKLTWNEKSNMTRISNIRSWRSSYIVENKHSAHTICRIADKLKELKQVN